MATGPVPSPYFEPARRIRRSDPPKEISVSTIAIVGAGPGMGLAIARAFGSHGFDVALVARNREKLNELAGRLDAEGITSAAFPADVLDPDALTRALQDAAARFDGID